MSIRSALSVGWIAIRPKTLAASISPIVLGSALAYRVESFSLPIFLLALICALALQIAVNLANDFFDAKSGVDTDARQGPQRVSQSGLVNAAQMKWALGGVSSVAFISGLFIVLLSSPILIVFGLLSLLAVFAYSGGPKPLASHGLGELTVFFFFGWLAVGGTYFAHSLNMSWQVLGYASVAGLLSAAIMLVNNIRDQHTDAAAGKNTLAVRLGEHKSRRLYQLFIVFALIMHLIVSFPLGLTALLPMVVVAPMSKALLNKIWLLQGPELNGLLASTAKLELVYCALVGLLLLFV